MRKSKHFLALALVLILALCLTACGNSNSGNGGNGGNGNNSNYSDDNNGSNGNSNYSDDNNSGNDNNNGGGLLGGLLGGKDDNGNNSNGGNGNSSDDNNGGNGGSSNNNSGNGNSSSNNSGNGNSSGKSDTNSPSSKKRANDAWTQVFLFSYYDYSDGDYNYQCGIADISIDKDGYILVDLSQGEDHTYYTLEETKFDQIVYSYGEVTEAIATLPGGNEDVILTMVRDVDTDPEYSLYVAGNASNDYTSRDYYLYPYQSGPVTAPADFKDKDEYGYIETILNDPSHFLYPTTDNCIITAQQGSSYYYDYDTGTSTEYPCIDIYLYEFDKNDIEMVRRQMTIYEDEAAASRMLSYRNQYDNYYTKQGTALCYTDPYDSYILKETLYTGYSYKRYDGMHYAYGTSYYGFNYMYSSQPLEVIQQFDLETIKTLMQIPSGTHRSTDSKDYTMGLYGGAYSDGYSVSFQTYSDDYSSKYSVSSANNTYYRNNVATSIKYSKDYDGNFYVYIYVTEFSTTEATATCYTYILDSLDDVKITVDNYKDFTPNETLSHSFDMTRVKQD